MSGTSWLLGGGYPWYPDPGPPHQPGALVANPRTGLALASLAAGLLGLGSPDESLGGLILPRGIAVEGDALFVLSQAGDLVYRYDALHEALVALRTEIPETTRNEKERRFLMATQDLYEQWKQRTLQEGRQQGRPRPA